MAKHRAQASWGLPKKLKAPVSTEAAAACCEKEQEHP